MKNARRIFYYIFIVALFTVTLALCFACGNKPKTDEQNTPINETPYYTVLYISNGGGIIEGDLKQIIIGGNDTQPVTAVPTNGYQFSKWSDGIITPERRELNVAKSQTIYAIFERCTIYITYNSDEGGYIEGLSEQGVPYCEKTQSVTAKPLDNYVFSSWSDGLTTATRQEYRDNRVFLATI